MNLTVDELVNNNRRLIESEAAKYATNLPLISVQIEAYKLAREAAKKYDPSTGVKFSTYLVNSLKKLSRLSTQYGASVRIPENTQFKINRLNAIERELEANFGRKPTASELSDASGFDLASINNLLQSRKNIVNITNVAYTPVFKGNDSDDSWIRLVYHDLAPKDKLIFEHKTGMFGKEQLDNDDIAKTLKISKSTLNNRIRFITNKLKEGAEFND